MKKKLLRKINSEIFRKYFNSLLTEIGEKRVLIYGACSVFEELKKKFDLTTLNVVAISDVKFTQNGQLSGIKSITPDKIKECDFDLVLMISVPTDEMMVHLQDKLENNEKIEIKRIWDELLPQEIEFLEYLEKINFEKHLQKLAKKLKNKKIVIYGAGVFFQIIKEYYDLSNLNIIAVSDKKFENHAAGESFLGYPICSPEEIKTLNPDYVLVAIRWFVNLIENLYYGLLADTKIKVKPLIKKPIKELFNEIWRM